MQTSHCMVFKRIAMNVSRLLIVSVFSEWEWTTFPFGHQFRWWFFACTIFMFTWIWVWILILIMIIIGMVAIERCQFHAARITFTAIHITAAAAAVRWIKITVIKRNFAKHFTFTIPHVFDDQIRFTVYITGIATIVVWDLSLAVCATTFWFTMNVIVIVIVTVTVAVLVVVVRSSMTAAWQWWWWWWCFVLSKTVACASATEFMRYLFMWFTPCFSISQTTQLLLLLQLLLLCAVRVVRCLVRAASVFCI